MGESLTQRRRVRDEGLRIVNLARRLLCKSGVKSHGSTVELPLILHDLNPGEGGGIPGVGVKSVDIWRNISGEGGHLDRY